MTKAKGVGEPVLQEGNPLMALRATLRYQYWLNGQVPQVGKPAHGTVLPYTLTPLHP
ncbi:MAG: hypothetical protein KME46_11140 [Brasilonema angustatum HA4187-MV1]|jgi:hypothetical protein|nr:hypothetical protein [Brasilonema angustatum HA4187-MV1]